MQERRFPGPAPDLPAENPQLAQRAACTSRSQGAVVRARQLKAPTHLSEQQREENIHTLFPQASVPSPRGELPVRLIILEVFSDLLYSPEKKEK